MSAIEPIGKTCCECRHDKPLDRFPYSAFTADGRTGRCLDCISAAAHRERLHREQRRGCSPKRGKPPSVRRPAKHRGTLPIIYA